jgi:DNA-binding response OmpR family regulator
LTEVDKILMKRSPIKPTETILSVSREAEDHNALKTIFRQHSSGNKEKWKVLTCSSLEWATTLLQRDQIPIAICERDLPNHSWRDLLEETLKMAHSPLVIVACRHADERLWAEVLNLGGWDVLAKPFDHDEVVRVVDSAYRRWTSEHPPSAMATRLAAGWA